MARDKEIDDALQVLYEKNLVLKDRAIVCLGLSLSQPLCFSASLSECLSTSQPLCLSAALSLSLSVSQAVTHSLILSQAVADHSKRVTAIETELSHEMEKVTARADGASSQMKKITDAIDGKGPGKICVYIMIALGNVGLHSPVTLSIYLNTYLAVCLTR